MLHKQNGKSWARINRLSSRVTEHGNVIKTTSLSAVLCVGLPSLLCWRRKGEVTIHTQRWKQQQQLRNHRHWKVYKTNRKRMSNSNPDNGTEIIYLRIDYICWFVWGLIQFLLLFFNINNFISIFLCDSFYFNIFLFFSCITLFDSPFICGWTELWTGWWERANHLILNHMFGVVLFSSRHHLTSSYLRLPFCMFHVLFSFDFFFTHF